MAYSVPKNQVCSLKWLSYNQMRKFTVACGTILLAFGLALMGKLTSEFVNIAMATIMAFSGANAVEHFVKNRK